jgi:hypothetical protein
MSDGFWKFDNADPEIFHRTYHVHEAIQIHRLGDIAIGVVVVRSQYILFGGRGRQHNDRNASESGVVLDDGKDLHAIHTWQIDIQQYQVGPFAIPEMPLPVEELQGLGPVTRHRDLIDDPGLGQRFQGQYDVPFIIVHKKDMDLIAPLSLRFLPLSIFCHFIVHS